MNTFLEYIRLGKKTRANAIVETALREKTITRLAQEKMRIAAALLDEKKNQETK